MFTQFKEILLRVGLDIELLNTGPMLKVTHKGVTTGVLITPVVTADI